MSLGSSQILAIFFDLLCYKRDGKETVCMKFQVLFSGKNKKTILVCHLLKFYPAG